MADTAQGPKKRKQDEEDGIGTAASKFLKDTKDSLNWENTIKGYIEKKKKRKENGEVDQSW